MKNVLVFSTVLFLGWCMSAPLAAQSCQPSPACKAVCAALKADAGAAKVDVAPVAAVKMVANKKSCSGAMASSDAAGVQVIPAGLFEPGTVSNTKNGVCNPPSCDPSKCDWSKCDLSKCDPTKCDWSKCLPANRSEAKGKAAAVRL